MLTWLEPTSPFPDPGQAMPEGLLAVGADLSVDRLRQAYMHGIFPWFGPGDPILWWSPDPRMVLECDRLKISHSLAKKLRQIGRTEQLGAARIKVTINQAFAQVIQACAAPRSSQAGTWISPEMQAAYLQWHKAGQVHSMETWIDGELAGGLYGVCLGRFFFGESMFSRHTDASKIALAYLVQFLLRNHIHHIDCQQQTAHLASMGACPMPRTDFLALASHAVVQAPIPWPCGQVLGNGELVPGMQDTP